jgi:hypothetical protein
MSDVEIKKDSKKAPLNRCQFSAVNQPNRRRSKGIMTILREAIGRDFKRELTDNEVLDIALFSLECDTIEAKQLQGDNIPLVAKIPAKTLLDSEKADTMYNKLLDRASLRRDIYAVSGNEMKVKYFTEKEEDCDGVDAMSDL